MRGGFLLALPLLLSCEPHALTQVVITVQAEPQVGALATRTTLVVTRNPAAEATVVHDDRKTPRMGGFPYVVALSPASGDADDVRFSVAVTALSNSKALLTGRLTSGYVAGQTRYVRLVLEDACLAVTCPADQTCHAGACVEAAVAQVHFGRDQASAPSSAELSTLTDGAPKGAKGDAGHDSASHDAGSADAALGSPPGPTDEDVDAGLAPDSGKPPESATPGHNAPDASHDASAPPSRLDAAQLGSPTDAARPSTAPDAAPPAIPDAGPAVTCMPSGTYAITRIQQTGTCNADIGTFDATFSGNISDAFHSDQCQLDATVSPDGCVMSYDQLCTIGDGQEVEREVATVRFTSANTISGPGKVTRYDTSKGSSPSSPTCASDVLITAVRE